MMIDIDHFKSFNDTYGHQQGDRCLQQVARTISLLFRRPGDVVARYGGEEFGVILPETPLAGALAGAERIRDAITGLQIEHAATESGKLSVSVGVTAFVPHAKSLPEEYVSLADMALYEAKRNGRNCVHTKLPKNI
jgi:diguanylate cyclase (GGDEF)-like protein